MSIVLKIKISRYWLDIALTMCGFGYVWDSSIPQYGIAFGIGYINAGKFFPVRVADLAKVIQTGMPVPVDKTEGEE